MKQSRWLVAAIVAGVLAAPCQAIVLVEDGQPRASIAVSVPGDATLRGAAELLQRYLAASTGATLPIVDEPGDQPVVLVGRGGLVEQLDLGLEAMNEDGLVLRGEGPDRYLIAGRTSQATEFAVCEFLERFVGVRWLLPGEHGTHVPKHDSLTIPADEIRLQPAFFSRLMSGLRGPAQAEWARRNRMVSRVSFHHNLLRLFPPSQYYATRPEFYPMVKGERYQPRDDDDPYWQPNFSAPGIVDEAVTRITAYFRANPASTSYSLGINDGRIYDESPESLARETGKTNFLGLRDVSDSYFAWANEVVERVLVEFPDKWFGCLAYSNVVEPPVQVKVHPRIIPYMTYDRMKWIDPDIAAQGQELTRQWAAMSPTLGWYDYAYGSPYALPRVYFHQMADYLRFGRDQGVRCHYAELYPNWGEGPKPYLYLKLQWDPDQDVDAVLDDWYTACVGESAAPLLREYYAIWERFWTSTVRQSPWWTPDGQYLAFSRPDYLALVDREDVRRSRDLLDQCLAQTVTAEQRWRAGILRDAFAYYEASALAYLAEQDSQQAAVTTEAAALAAIETVTESLAAAQRRLALVDSWRDDPVLVHPLDYTRYGAMHGKGWGSGLVWSLFDWLDASPAVRQRLDETIASEQVAAETKDYLRSLLHLLASEAEPLNANPSFEAGSLPWSFWVKFETGALRRTDAVAKTGSWSVVCDSLRRGGPNQVLQVEPGRYAATCQVWLPPDQTTQGTVEVSAVMRHQGGNLPSPSSIRSPVPGRWIRIVSPVTIPAEVGGKSVDDVMLIAIIDNAEGAQIHLDDLAFYRLPDPEGAAQ